MSEPPAGEAVTTGARPPRQESRPATSAVDEMAPGILRLQLPIAIPGLGHVNCYALEDDDGFALIDPGLPGPESWAGLTERLATAGIPLSRVHTVVCTHSHPDHFGGAVRLQQESGGAEVLTHESFTVRWRPVDDLAPEPTAVTDADAASPRVAVEPERTPWGGEMPGPPPDVLARYRALPPELRGSIRPPTPTLKVSDNDPVMLGGREWVALHTPGHTADHLCLWSPGEGILLSGDHVLPSITPHIGGIGAGGDPLADFFGSLDRLLELSIETALPAHGDVFTNVSGRVEDIHRHHQERLGRLRDLMTHEGPRSVIDLSHELFLERSWGPMAESETYAHLEHLRLRGEAERQQVGLDLVYSAAPEG